MTGFFLAPVPLVFGHRGGCALGPENTLLAFDRGIASGADGIELDVHLSSDGVVMVHHDLTLDRTTNASGPIASRSADELSRVDAGHWFGANRGYPDRGRAGGVPTLGQVLERFADSRVIIEMKVDSARLGLAAAEVVRGAEAAARVCFAGSGVRALAAARRALPQATTSAGKREVRRALFRSWCRWPVGRAAYGGYQVPERSAGFTIVTQRFIDDAHRAGLKVQVWTVDDEADMRRLLGWGVDALISNRPDVAVRVRNECPARV